MQIQDVCLQDIIEGTNFLLVPDTDVFAEMPKWEIDRCSSFRDEDNVVYSGLTVYANGEAIAILMVKVVNDPGWWGDTCELTDGIWRELDLKSNSDENPIVESYIANPLPTDPSFMGEYRHEVQRMEFAKWCSRLKA